MSPTSKSTHEQYILAIRDAVLSLADLTAEESDRVRNTKLIYGVGSQPGARGVCYYQTWENGVGTVDVVEIAAMVQEGYVQLAGTVVHELAHVLAGPTAGHSGAWKYTAARLGFQKYPEAAGQRYWLSLFRPALRERVYRLAAQIGDGQPGFLSLLSGGMGAPVLGTTTVVPSVKPRPCSAGIGTRGGTSRGRGSGSRLRLWQCGGCDRPVKVRVASDDFQAHCDRCGEAFKRG